MQRNLESSYLIKEDPAGFTKESSMDFVKTQIHFKVYKTFFNDVW